jgi:hypothetical protein
MNEATPSNEWLRIRSAVKALADDWGEVIGRISLEKLLSLAEEARQLLDNLPPEPPPFAELCEKAVGEIIFRLKGVDCGFEFDWIGDDVLASIRARWGLAALQIHESRQQDALLTDAAKALERLADAAAKLGSAK